MRFRSASVLATLACAALLVWAGGGAARPRDSVTRLGDAGKKLARGVKASTLVGPVDPRGGRTITPSSQPVGPLDLALGRAAMARSTGDVRGVIASLEPIAFDVEPASVEADRAAFLLGQAYLESGAVDEFVALAKAVAGWRRHTGYTDWLAFQRTWIEARTAEPGGIAAVATDSIGASGVEAARVLAAGELLERGDAEAARRLVDGAHGVSPALAAYIEALAAKRSGVDDEPALTVLSTADTVTALGRDLAGVALIRRATRRLALDQDPAELLERVPSGSRYASRARHMLGLVALERRETERGTLILEELLAKDSTYADRREVMRALAGHALDEGAWEAANGRYRDADTDLTRHRDALRRLLDDGSFDTVWSAWDAEASGPDALTIDALPVRMLANQLAAASTNLTARPVLSPPAMSPPSGTASLRWPVAPPPPEERDIVAAAGRRAGEAAHAVERTRWAIDTERRALDDRARYLTVGRDRAGREAAELEARTRVLDSLAATLAERDARLQAVRDDIIARVGRRAAATLEACDRSLVWIGAMEFTYLDGTAVPSLRAGPSPDSLLVRERLLAEAIRAAAARIAAESPGMINKSYAFAWRPGLIDRAARQAAEAHADLAWVRSLETALGVAVAACATSPTLEQLAIDQTRQTRTADSLAAIHGALKAQIARAAVERTVAALDSEREAIDYGLAASAYGASVLLATPDSGAAVTRSAAGDSAYAANETDVQDDPESARWRAEAITLFDGFLDRHPDSFARGEVRFRLADLLLVQAQQEFREAMARYVRAQSDGHAAGLQLPVLSHARPLALYRAILDEDPSFEHRDAVMFNAGMILADEGDPAAEGFFAELVAKYPTSAYVQESYVRMGDARFNEHQYLESVEFYSKAVIGADPTLKAMAGYKLGWAHYNEDRFAEAADAFRNVLDLYTSPDRAAIQVDLEGESEAYLVHCLAGAGGATAAAAYFDGIGARPYERRVLMALGQHFRRYGDLASAAEVDELCIIRYPLHADALVSAERLVETRERSENGEQARAARSTYAEKFAPGSPWVKAQTVDSVRTEGERFARASWTSLAWYHHRAAREKGAAGDWREARRLYLTLLEHWPSDSLAPSIELNVGEASARLGEREEALAHYAAAARTGPDSVASEALWQRVAVTDAWYDSTRTRNAKGELQLGSDSLARAVIDRADALLGRFPEHPRGADLAWRQGHLALAHGWFERAAQDFARLPTQWPSDSRAPLAAGLGADALFRLGKYEEAGAAWEQALTVARSAGNDSLAQRAEAAIPVCYFRQAEAAVAADSSAYARHAALFEKVASRWPTYEHAHLAQYRAGLAYFKAGQVSEGVLAMQALIRNFAKSEFVRDAHLEIARAWEAHGDRDKAADAYIEFAHRFPDDESAGGATLKAAELLAASGNVARADDIRIGYIRANPGDVETAMALLEDMARRELALVGPAHPISTLLPAPPPVAVKKTKGKAKAAPKAAAPAEPPKSRLAEYLALAKAHPDHAAPGVLAQVEFLKGEEAFAPYASARLTQPLDASIPAKQKLLDGVVGRYRACVELGVAEWAHAATFRIGEALVAFGAALETSERPADLQGNDLSAYEDVLFQQSRAFFDRGEGVWMDLLRQKPTDAGGDTWIAKTQDALWHRLGGRFEFRPELEFPTVAGSQPKRPDGDKTSKDTDAKSDSADAHAQREDTER